mmetsp:Transcript_17985/g.44902  ORF Transcript_17985/g.44902 Transcript_17985/m.44902 type:complete len:344 (+) Transcript_17985:2946-3977(+)
MLVRPKNLSAAHRFAPPGAHRGQLLASVRGTAWRPASCSCGGSATFVEAVGDGLFHGIGFIFELELLRLALPLRFLLRRRRRSQLVMLPLLTFHFPQQLLRCHQLLAMLCVRSTLHFLLFNDVRGTGPPARGDNYISRLLGQLLAVAAASSSRPEWPDLGRPLRDRPDARRTAPNNRAVPAARAAPQHHAPSSIVPSPPPAFFRQVPPLLLNFCAPVGSQPGIDSAGHGRVGDFVRRKLFRCRDRDLFGHDHVLPRALRRQGAVAVRDHVHFPRHHSSCGRQLLLLNQSPRILRSPHSCRDWRQGGSRFGAVRGNSTSGSRDVVVNMSNVVCRRRGTRCKKSC